MSRHQNKMFLPVSWHASKPIMCAGKATLSKELFFKDSAHPVLAGGSEGRLILKNKAWMQVAERIFLLLGAAAHTAPAWKGFCFSRQNPGKSHISSNQLKNPLAKVNARVGDGLSEPGQQGPPQKNPGSTSEKI